MPDLVTLSCPSCGGKLNITNDIERFACGHSGREHVVKRAGGIVSLSPVVEALKKVVFPFLIVAGILVAVVSLSTRNAWVPIL
ncbi:MAG: hypothetical protein IMZ73_07575 [Chloroflexi bacterium]|nr:hypothetical protein [Chloroflexota bacterium]